MSKLIKTFNTIKGPKPIGPYSNAAIYNGILFLSGNIGINNSQELVCDDVQGQAKQALENMKILLEQSGCGFGDVIKTTIYLKTMKDFGKINVVYTNYFKDHNPARVCIAVAELPKNAKFEIDAIVACRSQLL